MIALSNTLKKQPFKAQCIPQKGNAVLLSLQALCADKKRKQNKFLLIFREKSAKIEI